MATVAEAPAPFSLNELKQWKVCCTNRQLLLEEQKQQQESSIQTSLKPQACRRYTLASLVTLSSEMSASITPLSPQKMVSGFRIVSLDACDSLLKPLRPFIPSCTFLPWSELTMFIALAMLRACQGKMREMFM
ncbi:unnamed protein product [Natator depressus]